MAWAEPARQPGRLRGSVPERPASARSAGGSHPACCRPPCGVGGGDVENQAPAGRLGCKPVHPAADRPTRPPAAPPTGPPTGWDPAPTNPQASPAGHRAWRHPDSGREANHPAAPGAHERCGPPRPQRPHQPCRPRNPGSRVKGPARRHPPERRTAGRLAGPAAGRAPGRPPTLEPAPPTLARPHVTWPVPRSFTAADS